MSPKKSLFSLCLILFLSAITPIWSQEEEKVEHGVVTTVTVTADKREEKLAEVPHSVSVLTAENLEESGAYDIREAFRYIPNLYVSGFSSKRTSTPYIRGIGAGQGEPAVTTYIDGVPQLTPSSTNIELLDLERIEVLRGPQGTLYGKNTMGGLVHYITRDPAERRRLNARLELGDDALQRLRVSYDTPLAGDTMFFGVDASVFKRDGYTENDVLGKDVDFQDTFFGRVQLQMKPTKSWKIRFQAHHQKDDDGGFLLYDLGTIRERPHHLSNDYEGLSERDLTAASVTVDYYGDRFDFTSITAFETWDTGELSDLDFTAIDLLRRQTDEDQDQLYQELRISSPRGDAVALNDNLSISWIAGVSFSQSEFTHFSANEYRPNIVQLPFSLFESDTYELDDDSFGVFGQATFTIYHDLDLSFGLRYVEESKDADILLQSQLLPPPLNNVPVTVSEDYDEILPRFGLTYRWNDTGMGYASISKGYRSGGYNRNVVPGAPFTYDEETSQNYEVGAKLTLSEGRILLSGALFRIDWDDQQLSVPNLTIPGRFYLDNVGESRSQGVEFELIGNINRNWDIALGLGLVDAEYTSYNDPNTGQSLAGKQAQQVPDANWSIVVNNRGTIAGAYEYYLRGEFFGVGDQYYDIANTEGQDAYQLTNFRFGVARGGIEVVAWVKNAFDEVYVPLAIQGFFSPSGWAGRIGDPRTFGLTLGYRF